MQSFKWMGTAVPYFQEKFYSNIGTNLNFSIPKAISKVASLSSASSTYKKLKLYFKCTFYFHYTKQCDGSPMIGYATTDTQFTVRICTMAGEDLRD